MLGTYHSHAGNVSLPAWEWYTRPIRLSLRLVFANYGAKLTISSHLAQKFWLIRVEAGSKEGLCPPGSCPPPEAAFSPQDHSSCPRRKALLEPKTIGLAGEKHRSWRRRQQLSAFSLMPACRRLDGAAWGADHITFAQVSQVMKSFLVICSDKKLAHVPVFFA